MNEAAATTLRPDTAYRVVLWLPEPEPGAGARLFHERSDWPLRLAHWLRAGGFHVEGVRLLYGPAVWGPRGYRADLGDYAQLWVVDLEISGGEVPVSELESAMFAALDSWVKVSGITEVTNQTPYVAEPNLSLGVLQNYLGELAVVAVVVLAVVIISRIWPLGGAALLAALLIVVLNGKGGAHAQA